MPGLRVAAGPGPALTRIEDCLSAILAAVNVTAACIACTWQPEHIDQPAAHQALTRLAATLGIPLTWQTKQDANQRQ
jgi:arginase